MSDYRTFVVPYDFSDHARAALFIARDLAERLRADLHLVHVVQPPIYAGAYGAAVPPQIDMRELRDGISRSLQEVVEECRGMSGNVEAHVVEDTNVAASLQDTARKLGADLIVMGTHGRTGLAHVFLGSVAERTLRQAPCPVLTVPVHDAADADDEA